MFYKLHGWLGMIRFMRWDIVLPSRILASDERSKVKLVLLAVFLLAPVTVSASESGHWRGEDCEKLSAASARPLFLSGKALEEGGTLKDAGQKKQSDEQYPAALFLSELAANYAKNFEVFCKLRSR